MNREEFKARWESDDRGGGITFEDIASCAVSWGLYRYPKTAPLDQVRYQVLKSANTSDCEDYKPKDLEN